MKIEIEIDDETAALVWADRTWEGREKCTMAEIVKDLAEEAAAKYRNAFPEAVARVVCDFAKANGGDRHHTLSEDTLRLNWLATHSYREGGRGGYAPVYVIAHSSVWPEGALADAEKPDALRGAIDHAMRVPNTTVSNPALSGHESKT